MSLDSERHPPIWLLVATMVAVGSIVALWQLKQFEAFGESSWWIWPITVAGFAAADSAVVRVHLRSETTQFTFIELPLFLAALYVSPTAVWGAMIIGVTVSMFVVQRATVTKGVFNVANSALQGGVGLWVFHELVTGRDPLGPAGWGAATAAAVVSSAIGAGAIVVVLLSMEGRAAIKGLGIMVFMGAVTAIANVSLALIGASLIDYRPSALVLLVLPTVLLFGAYRAYTSERIQRDRNQAMHGLALEIRSLRDHAGLAPVLRLAANLLGAERADLVLFPDDRTGGVSMQYCVDASSEEVTEVVSSQLASVLDQVHVLAGPELRESVAGDPQVVGVIRGAGRPMGLLKFEGRIRGASAFTTDDRDIFVAAIEQLGLILEKNQLGDAVTMLEQRGRELQHEANHDPLTGLANRTLLAQRLEEELRFNRRPSLLYVDLDDFKDVNDQFGHDAGDGVLIEVSRRFQNSVGPSDCVARIGGDEFAVLVGQFSDDVGVANSLLRAASAPIDIANGQVQVHASIGIARASSGADAAMLLKRADVAMYNAKERGKGTLAFAAADC